MSSRTTISAVVFQKTMQDLIKGMRANKENTSEFISVCIGEIKEELSSTDPFAKAEAVSINTFSFVFLFSSTNFYCDKCNLWNLMLFSL